MVASQLAVAKLLASQLAVASQAADVATEPGPTGFVTDVHLNRSPNLMRTPLGDWPRNSFLR